jgi:DNA-binding NtrC family response regulator
LALGEKPSKKFFMNRRPILIVEDEPELGRVLRESLSQNGYSAHLAESAEKALNLIGQKAFDLIVSDIRLPDMSGLQLLDHIKGHSHPAPVILMTGFGSVQSAVEAMKKGAFDYLLKPFSLETLELGIENALHQRFLGQTGEAESPSPPSRLPIITQDRKMKEVLALCGKIAPSKATVLIQGESGTGKELLARYIHEQSQRSQGPFVAVNCASLPETLLESELFGHEKGAFTGAMARKIGKFELSHRGTILLDEISEMNTFLQAKILRVLQENEVDRIGGSRPIPIDLRVIATTNRDLEAWVKKGAFREDLYYRLKVIDVILPPLRERPEDVELLTHHFLRKFADEYARPAGSVSDTALTWLKEQEWRGNVRELRNVIERAVLISSRNKLEVQDFWEDTGGGMEKDRGAEGAESASFCLRHMEQRMISRALEKTQGNRTHAAKMLGISIRTLRNKLNEYKKELPAGLS